MAQCAVCGDSNTRGYVCDICNEGLYDDEVATPALVEHNDLIVFVPDNWRDAYTWTIVGGESITVCTPEPGMIEDQILAANPHVNRVWVTTSQNRLSETNKLRIRKLHGSVLKSW